MTETLARQLAETYVDGWVAADIPGIVSTLRDDCFITESHGPTYHGPDEVRQWAEGWYRTGTVDLWKIDAFFFDAKQDTAFFEWSFTCTIDGETTSLDGASIVQYKGGKIYHIHEYRMTKPPFDYFAR